MIRVLLTSLLTMALFGSATAAADLVGEPVYSKSIKDDVLWESIIVYGKLQKEVLTRPTEVYGSSFGHSYCMAEEVTFEAIDYIKGAGPKVIEFTQNVFESCQPIAENIGFENSIIFLSKNRYRGVWSTAGIRIDKVDGEERIVRPADIAHFISFSDFDALLGDHEEPLNWGIEIGFLSEEDLETLEKKGVVKFRPAHSGKGSNPYPVDIYKYIRVAALRSNAL